MSFSPRAMVRLLLFASMPVALGACTIVGGGASPARGPVPVAPGTRRASEPNAAPTSDVTADDVRAPDRITTRIVDVALASIGTPYKWGGSDENGFDCSGLIQFAYGTFGIRLPRTSTAQMYAGFQVAPEPALLRPGDVLGFSGDRPGKTDHVGLYIGASEFIHSSSSGVRVSSLRNPYWMNSLVTARRIVE